MDARRDLGRAGGGEIRRQSRADRPPGLPVDRPEPREIGEGGSGGRELLNVFRPVVVHRSRIVSFHIPMHIPRRVLSPALGIALAAFVWLAQPGAQQTPASQIVIRGVTLIDGTGRAPVAN